MTRWMGYFGWVAVGMGAGAFAATIFDVPTEQLSVWMIFGVSGGIMAAALFGRPSRPLPEDDRE